MNPVVEEWVQRAEQDFQAANRLADPECPLPPQACFFAQQSAEKYLKACLTAQLIRFSKTHDLVALLSPLRAKDPVWNQLEVGADFLNPFAVETRYPGAIATEAHLKPAIEFAAAFRDAARRALHLEP